MKRVRLALRGTAALAFAIFLFVSAASSALADNDHNSGNGQDDYGTGSNGQGNGSGNGVGPKDGGATVPETPYAALLPVAMIGVAAIAIYRRKVKVP